MLRDKVLSSQIESYKLSELQQIASVLSEIQSKHVWGKGGVGPLSRKINNRYRSCIAEAAGCQWECLDMLKLNYLMRMH